MHGRNISTSVNNWKKLLEQAFRCTKPGGYVELAELGCRVFCDDGSSTLAHLRKQACR